MLETKDLFVKKAAMEDWRDMYYNLWRHADSAKYMLWNATQSEEEARARMERTLAWEASHAYNWLVYEKASGQAIGFAGLEVLEEGVCGETGIAIGPAFTGKGYGKQILNALTDYARKELGAKKFVACSRTANTASHHLQMACGFVFSHFSEEKTDPRTGETYVLEYNVRNLCK